MLISGLNHSSSVPYLILTILKVVAAFAVAIIIAEEAAGKAQAIHFETFRLIAFADDGLLLVRFLMLEQNFFHLFL